MTIIYREPARFAQSTYDLIIVGGGIYGAMLCLEAGARGLRSLLLEKDDFGGATSYNSLRIIHGGFRYLQSLDLKRFYESVGERRWFLQTFPGLVTPLPCLMPLYGKGVKHPMVLAGALRVNDWLSIHRNQGVQANRHLSSGHVIGPDAVRDRFPSVAPQGLKGGAVWFDACMPDSQRILISVLRWAISLGGTALNYVVVDTLLTNQGQATGICAKDMLSGEIHEYTAPVVVNATGPWSEALASKFDTLIPPENKHLTASKTNANRIFRPSLAWNILFDRPALSESALAITSKQSGAQTYFLQPWKNRLLAGTIHNSWNKPTGARPHPSIEQIETFLENLNRAIPDLRLQRSEILRVFAGILPVKQTGSTKLSSQEVIFDHGRQGGVKGLYSIAGVKFTTSRLVADRTLSQAFPSHPKSTLLPPPAENIMRQGQFDYNWWPSASTRWIPELMGIMTEESIVHLDDLILRRTSLADNPERGLLCGELISQQLSEVLGWDEQRRCVELERLSASLSGHFTGNFSGTTPEPPI